MLSRLVTITPGGGLVTELCSTLAISWTVSLPDSSVHGILQTSLLEWFVMSSSRGSSGLRDSTLVSYVSCIGRQVLHHYGFKIMVLSSSFFHTQ